MRGLVPWLNLLFSKSIWFWMFVRVIVSTYSALEFLLKGSLFVGDEDFWRSDMMMFWLSFWTPPDAIEPGWGVELGFCWLKLVGRTMVLRSGLRIWPKFGVLSPDRCYPVGSGLYRASMFDPRDLVSTSCATLFVWIGIGDSPVPSTIGGVDEFLFVVSLASSLLDLEGDPFVWSF